MPRAFSSSPVSEAFGPRDGCSACSKYAKKPPMSVRHDWTFGRGEKASRSTAVRADRSGAPDSPGKSSSFLGSALHAAQRQDRRVPRRLRLLPAIGRYDTPVAGEKMLSVDEVLDGGRPGPRVGRDPVLHGGRVARGQRGPAFDRVLSTWSAASRRLGLEACCTLGMLYRGTGRPAERSRARRVQPQRRHLARTLQVDHLHPHVRRSFAYPAQRAQGGNHRVHRGHHRMGESIDDRCQMLVELSTLDPHPRACPSTPSCASKGRRSPRLPPVDPLESGADDRLRSGHDAEGDGATFGGAHRDSARSAAHVPLRGANSIFTAKSSSPHPIPKRTTMPRCCAKRGSSRFPRRTGWSPMGRLSKSDSALTR